MKYGDFVLTPSWTAHDHGNRSKKPMIWLDVLDVPTINFFETAFAEHLDDTVQNTKFTDNDSLWRYGSGVLPDGTNTQKTSPIINYAYERVRPILDRMAKTDEINKYHGFRLRYANPFNGGWSTPTMGAHLSLLPKGFKGQPYRSTDGTIFACLEGKGQTTIDGEGVRVGSARCVRDPVLEAIFAQGRRPERAVLDLGSSDAGSLGIWREVN